MSVLRMTLLALSAALFLTPLSVSAQTPPVEADAPELLLKQQTPSHPERVLLAFHKLAGTVPDFKQWAALSPFLNDASDSDVPAIVNRETNRLSRAYTEYDKDQVLVVHTTVQMDDYSTINGVLHLNEFSTATFFTFGLYGENIAIVPKDMAKFGDIPLAKAKMDEMLSKSQGSKLQAEILLKPVVADARKPFLHNDVSYGLLLAEIAEIRLWSPGTVAPELLWTYRADWYQPKVDQTLMNLKAEGGIK